MHDRDKELDQLLKPLMDLKPDDNRIWRWQRSLRPRRFWVRQIAYLSAAAGIGFLVGTLTLTKPSESPQEKNFDPNATFESVYIKG